ncbi:MULTISPECIES: amidoligase family protein [unclassified Clostridium]|uniref:amidoligase family protein n=1 Tax=unclassified Clostridium TaxID=2614128 RepID=UPI0025BF7A7B|nr:MULTISPECIES: amidoligase family protein [unclassified Clostridium]
MTRYNPTVNWNLRQRRNNNRNTQDDIRNRVNRLRGIETEEESRTDFNDGCGLLATNIDWGLDGVYDSCSSYLDRRGRRERQPLDSYLDSYSDHSYRRSFTAIFGETCNDSCDDPRYIKSYDYKPTKFNFNKTVGDNDNLYLGIELEIDNGGKSEETAKYIQEFLGEENCYIMSDGSLTNGLEITTHPCSLNYHKQLPYQELFTELIHKGYKSHDTQTCGYHIHVNRDYFSKDPTTQDLCITKVLYLIEKYWDEVVKIARRGSNRFSRRFGIKENESMFELLIKAKGKGNYMTNSKYNMLNLDHKDTIEFRLFKGTLKYSTFIATMEFISNLVYICKVASLDNIQNIKFEDIINIKESEFLINYLKERSKVAIPKSRESYEDIWSGYVHTPPIPVFRS